ncbi:MAG: nicotinate-nicotinamide nucleotide adenylyltransferase, partial [Acidimicrobiales bacterium]
MRTVVGGERLGVLGGTFDPPHHGHLATALEVRHRLRLDRVLLVVANDPWQKTALQPVTPAVDRLALVRAAVEGLDGLEANADEIDRGGESYTADTLAALRRRHPAAALFVIVGSDAAEGLDTWK